MLNIKELPLPDFYVPGNARTAAHRADVNGLMPLAEHWRTQHNLKPVGSDSEKVHLLVIDTQVDFSFPPPDGALYVAGRSGTGAMDANRSTAEFIYRNLHRISQITCTLDSHVPYQVFYPSAHVKADGTHPTAHTIISADEFAAGLYHSNPAMAVQLGLDPVWLDKQWLHYCRQLEASGKYKLYLWPYHCMIGSDGHRLAGIIEEARLFHGWARGAANLPEIKGGNPLTECYSVFSPEVTTTWDGRAIPGAEKNTRLMDKLLTGSRVYLAGLASSHCVKESIADFLKYILTVDPDLAKKLYILEDCIAPVVIPNGPDFTDDAHRALDEFRNAGMKVVKSTDPVDL